jgi:hypothetical protein
LLTGDSATDFTDLSPKQIKNRNYNKYMSYSEVTL